jgi:hypothetical protein
MARHLTTPKVIVGSLVSGSWRCWKVMGHLGGEAQWEEVKSEGRALEGDNGTLAPSSLSSSLLT